METLFSFLVCCFGMALVVSAVGFVVQLLRKRDNKRFALAFLVCLVLFFICFLFATGLDGEMFLSLLVVFCAVAIPVSIGGLVVQAARKRPKKAFAISALACSIVFVICIALLPASDTESDDDDAAEDVVETQVEAQTEAEEEEEEADADSSQDSSDDEEDVSMSEVEYEDDLEAQLMAIGFTKKEAKKLRKTFLKCGIDDISGCEPEDSSLTIDDLIVYRQVIDDQQTFIFTIDNRKLIYISISGYDLYTEEDGVLMSADDIYWPETEVTTEVARELWDLAEDTLDHYFTLYYGGYPYYDAIGYGREDDNYMVQCEAKKNHRWIVCKVWFEYDHDSDTYEVTSVKIDGTWYK